MIKVALVRGKYLNNFEGQNFIFNKKKIFLVGFSSLIPLHQKFPFSVVKLPSIADLGVTPFLEKGIKWLSNRILGDSQVLFGLEKYASKFDIFDTADPHYFYSYQLAKLRKKGLIKKLIVTYCETIPFNNEKTRVKKIIKYFALNQADLIIVHTKRSKNALIKEKIDEKKIKILRLGVDLKKFKPKDNNHKKESLTILFVGRLVEEKGVLDLYQAFKIIKQKYKQNLNLNLKIVGGGPLKNELLNLINKDKLNRLVKIEAVKYEDMPKIYQKADIFVSCSKTTKTWEEQYGMVLIEAMACGLPIVAYQSGAIPEVIDKSGLLVEEGNIKGLISAILKIIKDKKLAKKLGKMGRKRAEKNFDAKKTAEELEKIYKELIKN